MTRITLTVNGEDVSGEVEPRQHLGDFLREKQLLTGTHLGCEHGVCGACTVLIDGVPARSCIAFPAALDGAAVTTIEGLADDPVMVRLRKAFNDHHALQCGYCTPGMLVMARDIVTRLPRADEHRVRKELAGNLCRCTGYVGIVRAICEVASEAPAVPEPPLRGPTGPKLPAVPPRSSKAPEPEKSPPRPTAVVGDMTRLAQSFTVNHPIETVWAFFKDMDRVVPCLPGARLREPVIDGVIKAEISVKMGPMGASFTGTGHLVLDDAEHKGQLTGEGHDALSHTTAQGDVTFHATASRDGGTTVGIELAYALKGPLAQFSRGGIARDLANRLTGLFAANLEKALTSGETPSPQQEAAAGLNLSSLVWGALKDWLARLFAGKRD
ncbi:MAG: 2Fe-2S iron-sulfur cluster-binding protein [Magnetovibrionaceae bacterium]